MQYSKRGPTNDLDNCKITSLSLALNYYLIILETILAVLTASRHCSGLTQRYLCFWQAPFLVESSIPNHI